MSPNVYELDVSSGIHPRFFVDFLRRNPDDSFLSQITDDNQPPPFLDGKNLLYGVEKILRAENLKKRD